MEDALTFVKLNEVDSKLKYPLIEQVAFCNQEELTMSGLPMTINVEKRIENLIELIDEEDYMIIAQNKSKLITGILYYYDSIEDSTRYLHTLYINPLRRGKGLGYRLLSIFMETESGLLESSATILATNIISNLGLQKYLDENDYEYSRVMALTGGIREIIYRWDHKLKSNRN